MYCTRSTLGILTATRYIERRISPQLTEASDELRNSAPMQCDSGGLFLLRSLNPASWQRIKFDEYPNDDA